MQINKYVLCLKNNYFLAERYYVTFGLWHRPSVCLSVCRLSSVTFVRPTPRVELLGTVVKNIDMRMRIENIKNMFYIGY